MTRRVLITGGAGFIGSNLAARLLSQGAEVTVFDNLSRPGTNHNLAWLQSLEISNQLTFVKGDLRDFKKLIKVVAGQQEIYHLAGQVAVTTSVKNPRGDFEDNALGTLNLLEAVRLAGNNPILLYASTNKVYGNMRDVTVIEKATRYAYGNLPCGVSETQALDFHSPYGCSKGAADQYVHDYARIYGLRTIVMRQSCIYGYRQLGVEDQGWVAWFIIAALMGKPISIYGDGKQVRDILFIDDLLDAYELVVQNVDQTGGEIFNVGGGSQNTLSVWQEFRPILDELMGKQIAVTFTNQRPGDQKVFISDIQKINKLVGWEPKISVKEGIHRLYEWLYVNTDLLSQI